MSREEAGTANANRRAQPCQPPHKSARKQTKRERSDSPAVALAVDLDLALDLQRLQEQDRSEGTRSAAEGRMQEQAVFGYSFPRKKVTRRKGGRGRWRHPIKWINTQFLGQPAKPTESNQKPFLLHAVLRLAAGFSRSGVAPEVAGRPRARSTARATAGESLRSRFVYLPADLLCGWQGCALRFALAAPASSRDKPAPTGIASNSKSAPTLQGRRCGDPTCPAKRPEYPPPMPLSKTTPAQTPPVTSRRQETGARGPVAQRRAGCTSKRFLVTFLQEKK
ncbi:hypothetical protein J3B00_002731 [Pseudomonas sp. BP8]|nr:hypothetical protein [Pseudomonas sp. BP8]